METINVTLSFRGGVTVTSADSHIRIHAEMSLDEAKETVSSLLYKLNREDAVELADRLNEELYR